MEKTKNIHLYSALDGADDKCGEKDPLDLKRQQSKQEINRMWELNWESPKEMGYIRRQSNEVNPVAIFTQYIRRHVGARSRQ